MSVVAVIGAGEIGGAVAHKLALRSRFREVRLLDAAVGVAQGKALDIRQSGPVDHFDTIVSGDGDVLASAGASVIVIADSVADGEWEGERGLTLVRQLARSGSTAPLIFAGPKQTWLMEAAARELGVGRDRLIGAAPTALVAAVRSIVALEVNGSSKDVALTIVGRPPAFTIAWSSATIAAAAVTERVPAHRLLAITQSLRGLWPPGPQAIAAAVAQLAEGLVFGGRQRIAALSVLDGEYDARGVAALLPLELGRGRILARLQPSLSTQERVEMANALEKRL